MPGQIARIALVFAVLLAQQTALAHQYWHATPKAVAAEQSVPAKGDKLCDLHDLLGTVLGVVAGTVVIPTFLPLPEPRFTGYASIVRHALPLAPHSRGPPLIS
ncbi:MAG TPA: hypothetical protein VM183_15585 [Burkholderiales bacterium]|nr:hypothetical protein [Burkholderiales bacterium]